MLPDVTPSMTSDLPLIGFIPLRSKTGEIFSEMSRHLVEDISGNVEGCRRALRARRYQFSVWIIMVVGLTSVMPPMAGDIFPVAAARQLTKISEPVPDGNRMREIRGQDVSLLHLSPTPPSFFWSKGRSPRSLRSAGGHPFHNRLRSAQSDVPQNRVPETSWAWVVEGFGKQLKLEWVISTSTRWLDAELTPDGNAAKLSGNLTGTRKVL
jgi:hypothetical protein